MDTRSDEPYGDNTAPGQYDNTTADNVTWSPSVGDSGDPTYGSSGDITGDPNSGVDVQVERINQTRSEMGQTIDAIQQKLSPDNLAQQAKDTVREATVGKVEGALNDAGNTVQQAASSTTNAVQQAGTSLIDTIKQNPIPAALAGVGLGWLFMSMRKNNQPSRQTYTYGPYGTGSDTGYRGSYAGAGQPGWDYTTPSDSGNAPQSGSGNAIGQGINQAQQAAGNVAGQAQDMAGQVANQVQDTAGQVMNQAQQQMSQLGANAQQTASDFQTMMRQNPLAVGAGALALGLAIGLAVPETSEEDRLLGPARESLTGQAQQVAQDTAQKVQNVAQEAVGAAKQEAKKENLI